MYLNALSTSDLVLCAAENVDFRVAFVCVVIVRLTSGIAYTVGSSRLSADLRWRLLRLHGFKCIVVRVVAHLCVVKPRAAKQPPAKHCSESVQRFVALFGRTAVSRRLNYGSGVTHPALSGSVWWWFTAVLSGCFCQLVNALFQCRKRVLVYWSAKSDVLRGICVRITVSCFDSKRQLVYFSVGTRVYKQLNIVKFIAERCDYRRLVNVWYGMV